MARSPTDGGHAVPMPMPMGVLFKSIGPIDGNATSAREERRKVRGRTLDEYDKDWGLWRNDVLIPPLRAAPRLFRGRKSVTTAAAVAVAAAVVVVVAIRGSVNSAGHQ